MSKRRRARQRQRRFMTRVPGPITLEREERPERQVFEPRREPRPRARGPNASRARGTPSNALLKAGALEYGYVIKDLRRIGVVSALLLLLLAAATFVVNTLPG